MSSHLHPLVGDRHRLIRVSGGAVAAERALRDVRGRGAAFPGGSWNSQTGSEGAREVKIDRWGTIRWSAVPAMALALLSCGAEPETPEPGAPGFALEIPAATAPRDQVVLVVESFGEVRIELLPDLAPTTAAHFLALAERDYFDGTSFHRVVPDFMIQGGDPGTRDRDPRNDGRGGQDQAVEDERPALSHRRGIVSLANRGVPNSGGSQFFILVADAEHLDGQHAVFGHVIEGMDVVDRIAAVERDEYGRHGPPDRPIEDVVLREVRVETAD
jgi:peptidyl-prolyl cis-trans isomerase B (cyclophilin B)